MKASICFEHNEGSNFASTDLDIDGKFERIA